MKFQTFEPCVEQKLTSSLGHVYSNFLLRSIKASYIFRAFIWYRMSKPYTMWAYCIKPTGSSTQLLSLAIAAESKPASALLQRAVLFFIFLRIDRGIRLKKKIQLSCFLATIKKSG